MFMISVGNLNPALDMDWRYASSNWADYAQFFIVAVRVICGEDVFSGLYVAFTSINVWFISCLHVSSNRKVSS